MGDHKIVITTVLNQDTKPTQDLDNRPELLPKEYLDRDSTPLTRKVERGSQVHDFDIDTMG